MMTKNEMNYKVGQVLFYVPEGRTVIIPIQVVEEVIKRTLDTVTTSYIVSMGTQNSSKTSDIAALNGQVYESAQKAKRDLTDKATAMISHLIDQAVKQASQWYGNSFEDVGLTPIKENNVKEVKRNKKNQQDVDEISSASEVMVKLEDGVIVKAKLPTNV